MVGQPVGGRTIERVADELRRIDLPSFVAISWIWFNAEREIVVLTINEGSSKSYQYQGTEYGRVGKSTPTMPFDHTIASRLSKPIVSNAWKS